MSPVEALHTLPAIGAEHRFRQQFKLAVGAHVGRWRHNNCCAFDWRRQPKAAIGTEGSFGRKAKTTLRTVR
jgi:hypothetical protein